MIRAVDYLIPPEDLPRPDQVVDADGQPIERLDDNTEGLVLRLFGTLPDYTHPAFEALWQEVNAAFRPGLYAWCRQRGIDVVDDADRPVAPWRDIAVMLMAEERGLIQRAATPAEGASR